MSFLKQELADKIIEERTHEQAYNNFKTVLLKATSKEHREEIMELKFGCEVGILTDDSDFYGKCKPEWNWVKIIKVSPKKAVFDVMWHYPNSEIDYRGRLEAKELKIIGRPLTLEDVIKSLAQKCVGNNDIPVFIDINGRLWNCNSEMNKLIKTNIVFELGKTAEHQSDETLIDITNLLK